MALDQVHIKDLLVRTIIGVNDRERLRAQDVLINITLYADLSAGASDHIDDVIDYSTLAKQAQAVAESNSFFLVEKLGLEIADICLQDSRVQRAVVLVEKPGAVRFSRSVGVTIDRSR